MDVHFYNTACREPENHVKALEHGNHTLCLPDQPNISEITRNISRNSLSLLIGGFGLQGLQGKLSTAYSLVPPCLPHTPYEIAGSTFRAGEEFSFLSKFCRRICAVGRTGIIQGTGIKMNCDPAEPRVLLWWEFFYQLALRIVRLTLLEAKT